MERTHAQLHYYFTREYFEAIRDELGDHARFVLAEYKGQVIAATLYLHDDTDVFWYLGGMDSSFQNVRATNALIYDTIRWAHATGKKRLILGGGYKPNDGVFAFKATFSRHRQAFHTYRRVHLENNYAALSQSWRTYYEASEADLTSYFPVYRCVPESISTPPCVRSTH
jgi:lipid II:glycine glycyltransferase (peptidoglycan interpeptide bridge formation enzyme)